MKRCVSIFVLLGAGLAACSQPANKARLRIGADPAAGPLERMTVQVRVGDGDGALVSKVHTETLNGRDLAAEPFDLDVTLPEGSAFATEAKVAVLAYKAGQAAPVASAVTGTDLARTDVVAVTLALIPDGCDEDGDGFKACAQKPECCSAEEKTDAADCDDTDDEASPFAETKACRVCSKDCGEAEGDGDGLGEVVEMAPEPLQEVVGETLEATDGDDGEGVDANADGEGVDATSDVDACACTTGACCDGCTYKASSIPCAQDVSTEYTCKDGTACGQDVYVRHQDRYCSGTDATCSGALEWDTEVVVDDCEETETCTAGSATCSTSAACSTVTPGFVKVTAGPFWMGSPNGEKCVSLPGYTGGGCPGAETAAKEPGRWDGEETLHKVTLTTSFEILDHEVTQAEWKAAYAGWNPSSFFECGDACPVETVNWYEAVAYTNLRSTGAGLAACYSITEVTCRMGGNPTDGTNYAFCMDATHAGIGKATVTLNGVATPYACTGYRLPTESEWERAYRAGSNTAFHPSPGNDGSIKNPISDCNPDSNLDQIGWYCGNASNTPHPTGSGGGKEANAWGLYDLAGNLSEWCAESWQGDWGPGAQIDPYAGTGGAGRVTRSGSWVRYARNARAAASTSLDPGTHSEYLGFRVVRSLPDE